MKKARRESGRKPSREVTASSSRSTSDERIGRASLRGVGIGASAGGLEALSQFFSYVPAEGMAFVLVPHLDPTHRGMMPGLLGRHGKMPVVEIGRQEWDIPTLRQLLEEITTKSATLKEFPVECEFPRIGREVLLLNARRIAQEDGRRALVLLAMEDITASSAKEGDSG